MTDDERIERALKSIGDAYVRENPPNYPAFREGVMRRQRMRRWFQAGSAFALAGATVAIGLFFARSAPLDNKETAPAGPVDVTKAITDTVGVGESPSQINVGRNAVWVTSKSGSVTRIDPSTKQGIETEVGGLPTDLAVGGSGVWITNNGRLQRLGLEGRGPVTNYSITGSTARMHVSVAPGSVWVVGDGQVFKVDPDNGESTRFAAGENPVDIAVAEGTLWALDESGRVQAFDARRERPLGDPIQVPAAADAEITLGSEALWHGVQGSSTFTRVDAETGDVTTVELPSPYVDMGVGQGEVWVLMSGDDGTGSFVPLDPDTGTLDDAAVRTVQGSPVDVAVGKQALWIINGTGHVALRIEKSSL